MGALIEGALDFVIFSSRYRFRTDPSADLQGQRVQRAEIGLQIAAVMNRPFEQDEYVYVALGLTFASRLGAIQDDTTESITMNFPKSRLDFIQKDFFIHRNNSSASMPEPAT